MGTTYDAPREEQSNLACRDQADVAREHLDGSAAVAQELVCERDVARAVRRHRHGADIGVVREAALQQVECLLHDRAGVLAAQVEAVNAQIEGQERRRDRRDRVRGVLGRRELENRQHLNVRKEPEQAVQREERAVGHMAVDAGELCESSSGSNRRGGQLRPGRPRAERDPVNNEALQAAEWLEGSLEVLHVDLPEWRLLRGHYPQGANVRCDVRRCGNELEEVRERERMLGRAYDDL